MQPPCVYLEDTDFKMPQKFLSEEEYAAAMESLVIVGTDVLFIDRAQRVVYLAKRIAKPLQGFWIIGGRMHAGEDEFEAMRRTVKRETSLDLAADRFQFLTFNRYVWKTRAQEPQDKGSDNLCYTFVAELSDDERAAASRNLDPDEYDVAAGLQEFDAAALGQAHVHQAIKDLYALVFPKQD